MSQEDIAKFEAIAGAMLRDLSYETGRQSQVPRLARIQADLERSCSGLKLN
ncbi:hypothetical protein [Pseudanabaena sp. PCC 6802]|uniref:hypothetical protein n=1 Tax=Pseudanabaena sp. PCC 6802 TaxID=118173 RepID=UPI000346EC11|nr:hypothetical protein [Pseudanabaena sp. PCC 6802]